MVCNQVCGLLYLTVLVVNSDYTVGSSVQGSEKFMLARKSFVFVDKTVLLKSIFKYSFSLITAPHKFGKTTNLQMIKLFLGNHNKKSNVADVFRETKIWQDREFIVQHVGNYPVIYCDFKPNRTISTLEDFAEELKKSVRNAFLEHRYLLTSEKIGRAIKQRYLDFCRQNVNEFETGLKFLSQVLRIHHSKKVVVLIDDFDSSLSFSIFNNKLDSTKVGELLFRVIDNTINLNEFVERAVVMGRLPFKLGVQFSGLYLLEHFKFLETKDFTPYFGFTQKETMTLLDKLKLGHCKQNVSNWYGGYNYLHSNFPMYNPWSVLMFLKTKQLDVHWVSLGVRKMLYEYLDPHYELKELLTKIIKNKEVTIQRISSFTTYEVDKLKEVQFGSHSYAEDTTDDHLFLQLLLESGYFTFAEVYRDSPISTKIKFPNLEIRKVFEQLLKRLSAIYHDVNRY